MIEKALQKVLGFGSKEFIEKAAIGGWRSADLKTDVLITLTERTLKDTGYLHQSILDPLAWKAVGKVEGWSTETCFHCEDRDCGRGKSCGWQWDEWQYHWHKLLDALAK
ncbi:MAG: hypothetical protein KJI69_05060 [Patescibacteria group bacterium]|nr:hypothetical protein [Patescibacteria group bacterium]